MIESSDSLRGTLPTQTWRYYPNIDEFLANSSVRLRRLVPLKNRAEYDPRPVPVSEAKSAVKAAERLLAIAERVVRGGGS
jgi:hypothetical protein